MSRDTTGRKWKRSGLRIVCVLAFIYGFSLVAVTLGQRKLIYFPTTLDSKVAEQMAKREGFEPWRDKTGRLIGWHLSASSNSQGSILIIHGNAGCALDRDYLAKPIRDAGSMDVFILEYPGYGCREGLPTEQSLLDAAEAAFVLLSTNSPRFLVSESLGTGPAAWLAGKHAGEISGVAMFAPYDDLAAVAQKKMWLFPVRLMLRDRFEPGRWLGRYHGPVYVVLAGEDEVIPTEFGQRLYDNYQGPKRVEIISGAHHNDIGETGPEWWKNVFAFWREQERSVTSAKWR